MKIHIIRSNDEVDVLLLKNKEENTYSFVNLTKGHICPCKFNSVDDALNDLKDYQNEGKIVSWKILEGSLKSEEYYCAAGVCPDLSDEYHCDKCTLRKKAIAYNGNKQIIACRSFEEWETVKDLISKLSYITFCVGSWQNSNSYVRFTYTRSFRTGEREYFPPELDVIEAKDFISCGKFNAISLDKSFKESIEIDKSQADKELF